MANTYSQLFYHLVFSTKGRSKLIDPEIESRVWAYVGGIARRHEMSALQIGGIEDHIHGLVNGPAGDNSLPSSAMVKGRIVKMDS